MSGLIILWLVALGMAGAAVAIMVVLILARAVIGRRAEAREAERRRLIPLLLAEDGDEQLQGRRNTPGLVSDLAVELIQLVRGTDRERFAERATRLGVPDQLRRQLARGNARQRQRAAEALAQFVDAQTVSALRAALDDPNPDVRLTAAISLAEKGEAPPAGELVERLGIGRQERSLLVAALFKEIAQHRSGDLELLLRDARAPADARVAAVEALAASGRYELVPLIAEVVLATPPGDRVLPRYLHALAAFGHPAAEAAVARCLDSPEPQVRGAAAAAAGRIGLVSLAPRLEALLGDSSWQVRFRAGHALARLGEEGRARLVERARERSSLSGMAAALILAERGS